MILIEGVKRLIKAGQCLAKIKAKTPMKISNFEAEPIAGKVVVVRGQFTYFPEYIREPLGPDTANWTPRVVSGSFY